MTAAGAVVCWGVLFAGCTPGVEPTPEPTPEPTFQCTPEAGGDAYGCDQAEYEAMVARDEQYAEAERVYRRALNLAYELRASRQPMSDELRKLVTNAYAKDLEGSLLDGTTSELIYSGQRDVSWVRREPDQVEAASVLALEVCTTPGSLKIISNDQEIASRTFQELAFFTREDGRLKLSSSKVAEVQSC